MRPGGDPRLDQPPAQSDRTAEGSITKLAPILAGGGVAGIAWEPPGWTWDTVAGLREEAFSRRLHYVERHGDALVPYSHTVDGYPLGGWAKTQHRFHTQGTIGADRAGQDPDITRPL
jgi:hypothetical protein